MLKHVITATCLISSTYLFSQKTYQLESFVLTNTVDLIYAKTSFKEPIAARILKSIANGIPSCAPLHCFPLPVQLLSLDATRNSNEQVTVLWQTTNEIDNYGFDIERATEPPLSFIKVGFVASKHGLTTKQKYQLMDRNDFEGTSYYRLKQIDRNGSFTYSKIVAVKGYEKNGKLSVYPNPVATVLSMKVHVDKANKYSINIADASGRIVKQEAVFFNKGINKHSINTGAILGGSYIIKLISIDGKEMSAMFIKQ